jgi:hypothetical protein
MNEFSFEDVEEGKIEKVARQLGDLFFKGE